MAFFVDWALWVKMVFVLGIAIVFTLAAGVIKLAHDHAKLKKFARIEQEKLEEQPMVEEFAKQRRGRQDVPFGVRAIESGIEVEGVWISRTNSPASSAPASPLLGPQHGKGKTPSKLSESSLLQPVGEQTHRSQIERSRSPNGSTGSFELATSAERLDSPSTLDLPAASRPTYQPRQPSSLRFSTADQLEAGQLPPRSVSDSSKSSSEDSSYSLQAAPHQQAREPSYYRPTGAGYAAVSGSGPPSPAMLRPEYVQPGRSNRNSNSVQGYTYSPAEQQSRSPQRFYGPSQPHSNISSSQSTPYLPDEEVFVDAPSRQRHSRLESIELTSNPVMTDSSSEKTKRVSRKLQKKQAK